MPDRSLLLERDGVLQRLHAAWEDAALERGSVHLVEGPAGIGKTAVIEAFVRSTDVAHRAVLHARCSPLSPTAVGGVVREWFSPLRRRVQPGAAPFDGPGTVLLHASAPPLELAYAVQWALEDLTADGPALVVVDDVHWGDPASLAVLDHVTAAVADAPVVVLLGERSGEPASAPEQVARIARRAARHPLRPLSREAVVALLPDLPADAAEEVARRSEGIPLFVRELAEAYRSGEDGTPRGVVEAVRSAIARLPDGALDVARVVSLVARPVTTAVVAAVAGRPAVEVLAILDALAGADVVVWADDEPDTVRMSHALVADAILVDLGAAGRAALHADLAAVLHRQGAPEEEVAGHLLHTPPSGRREVRDLLMATGRQALTSQAAELAARYFLRAVDEVGDAQPAELVPVLQQAARALAASGLLDQAQGVWRRAAAATDSTEGAARVMAEAGDALTAAGRSDEAVSLWRTWLERLPRGEAEEVRKGLVVRISMNTLAFSGMPPEFSEDVADVLSHPRANDTHGDRLLLAVASGGMTFRMRDSAETARVLARRAWGEGRLLEEETAAGGPVYLLTGVLDWSDDFELAIEVLDRAIDNARELGSTLALATALYCRGCTNYRLGEVNRAVDDLTLADELRRFGWDAYTPVLLQHLAHAHIDRGELAPAQALVPELQRIVGDRSPFGSYALIGLAAVAEAEDRLDDAAGLLEQFGEQARDSTPSPAMTDWRSRLARVRHRQGRYDAARAVAAEELALARAWGAVRPTARAAVVAAEVGVLEQREPLLREVLALTDPPPLRRTRERQTATIALGEYLLDAHSSVDRDQVVVLVQEAHARVSSQGLVGLQERAATLLARLGVAADAASPLTSLTPAERRVVELVLSGLSNREVAGRLFVTVKAVEWHLSSVYRKLGIRGRRELAAALVGG